MTDSARIYLLPVAGLLVGAGLAQLATAAVISPGAGAKAAGVGGIAGTVLAVFLGRHLAKRTGTMIPALPRIVGRDVNPPQNDPRRVDAPASRRVE